MANKNLTEIVFVIDASGSMFGLANDTIGGYNSFLKSQRMNTDGVARITTILFNNDAKTICECLDVREAADLNTNTYVPGGGTALLDAVGDAIEKLQDRHDAMDEADRPANVIFVVTTDGQENASTKYKKPQIAKMVQHQTNGHGWKFMFLGANVDSFEEASSLGFTAQGTSNYRYDDIGTKAVYTSVDSLVSSVRCCADALDNSDWSLSASYADALCDCDVVDKLSGYVDITIEGTL